MTIQNKGFQERIQRIEALTRKIEEVADPDLRASTRALLEAVMELHGAGFERMMDIIAPGQGDDSKILERLAQDDLVSSLLLLYGLHPDNFETRIQGAVKRLQSSARSHGNEIELLEISEDGVRLRLNAGHGCGSHAANLKTEVEQAIYSAAPDVMELVIETAEEAVKNQFVPLEKLLATNGRPQV
ncbi:MAG: thioredoxin-like protein [Acidobacteriaceae bacterium]|nr:thioredoxin-like protein [Acidobacteriaceae bacterium]